MLTQQNTQQLSRQPMADASSNNTGPMPISEDMAEQPMPEPIEGETIILDAVDQTEPSEHDFDGLDRLPEPSEGLAQSLDEVFEGTSDETRVILEGEQRAEDDGSDTPSAGSQNAGDLERTLAYPDGRNQPAAAVVPDGPADCPAAESGLGGTARVAALDDTQLRPYAIDSSADGDVASALREGDDLAYGLSQETHERPISRIGRIITIVVAGLLVAIVAYAITSIVLYGSLRLPTSSPIPSTQTNKAKEAETQEGTSAEEAQQTDGDGMTAEESVTTEEPEDQPEPEAEPEADTWTDEGVTTDVTNADAAGETEAPVDSGGEETAYDDQGAASEESSEEPTADASAASDEGAGE